MKMWQRYSIGLLVFIWLFGNIPAWLFLPVHIYSDGSKKYLAIWWSLSGLLVPIAVALTAFSFILAREFVRWIIGPRPKRESLEAKIARLERELGIGQE